MQTKVEICGVNTSGLPVLSAKKTDELLKKSATGDKQARDELIRGNLRLVLSVVQRFFRAAANRRTTCFRSDASA